MPTILGPTRRAILGAGAVGAITLAAPAMAEDSGPLERTAFPTLERGIYLDSAHRSAPARFITESGRQWLDDLQAAKERLAYNPAALENDRRTIAEALGAATSEVAFTMNTTHGLNQALSALRLRRGATILVPQSEFTGIEALAAVSADAGLNVRRVAIDRNGRIEMADLETALRSGAAAMIFSWVGFSTGARADIDSIGNMCQAHGAACLVDGMQALGFQSRPLSSLPVDAVATGPHKGLLAPPGVGILWVPNRSAGRFRPVNGGKGSYDDRFAEGARRFEYGNVNLLGARMLSAGCSYLQAVGFSKIELHIRLLSDRLLAGLAALDLDVITPADASTRLHIATVDFGGRASAVERALRDGGVHFTRHGTRLRFSVGGYNCDRDVTRLLALIRSSRDIAPTG